MPKENAGYFISCLIEYQVTPQSKLCIFCEHMYICISKGQKTQYVCVRICILNETFSHSFTYIGWASLNTLCSMCSDMKGIGEKPMETSGSGMNELPSPLSKGFVATSEADRSQVSAVEVKCDYVRDTR